MEGSARERDGGNTRARAASKYLSCRFRRRLHAQAFTGHLRAHTHTCATHAYPHIPKPDYPLRDRGNIFSSARVFLHTQIYRSAELASRRTNISRIYTRPHRNVLWATVLNATRAQVEKQNRYSQFRVKSVTNFTRKHHNFGFFFFFFDSTQRKFLRTRANKMSVSWRRTNSI